jgi:hypothetical protein
MSRIIVKDKEITIVQINEDDYISLTDIAKIKNDEDTNMVIASWIRRVDTIEFLKLWELINNENFKPTDFEGFKSKPGQNAFTISPKKWIELTNAIGLKVKSGRYNGGTYAHKDIALEFASWISAEVKLYIIKEFQRLKIQETSKLEWQGKRILTKLNYIIHTDAVKTHLITINLTNEQKCEIYASEADILNVALFGMTAKQWRESNPGLKGNIRDHASINQLICLSNMENLNSVFIGKGIPQSERLIELNKIAIQQMSILENSNKRFLK